MIFRALVFLLALTCGAAAQVGIGTQPNFTQLQPAPSGASYTGPGDIVSGAFAWYSCSRGYNAADTSNACNVCLPSAGACFDLTLSSGFAVVPAGLSTCNITTVICTVKTMYDKTGNGKDITNATQANQPTFRPAMASNGCPTTALPCVQFVGASSQFLASGTTAITQSQPITGSFVFSDTAANGDLADIGGAIGLIRFNANNLRMAAGGALDVTVADNTFHAGQFIFNGASSAGYIDGTNTPGNAGTNAPSSTQLIISGTVSIGRWTGTLAELGYWQAAFTTGGGGQASLMNTNQHSSANGYNF